MCITQIRIVGSFIMSVISVRVNDDEMSVLENASKMYSGGISSMIKKIVFERIEDEYDLSVAKEPSREKSWNL